MHLRRVVGNPHAAKFFVAQNPQHAHHIDIALVYEDFAISGYFALYIAEVHVKYFALLAVLFGGRAGVPIDQALVRSSHTPQGTHCILTRHISNRICNIILCVILYKHIALLLLEEENIANFQKCLVQTVCWA